MNRKQRYGKGALVHQNIRQLIEDRAIILSPSIENIQPASLDLSLSDEIYEVDGVFQPRSSETVRKVLAGCERREHNIKDPMEVGKGYMVLLNERFDLPKSLYGYCNPKSSTGRLDVHVRVLSDGHSRFDTIPHGYNGELWLYVISKSFNIKVEKSLALNQMRLFTENTNLTEWELESVMKKDSLIWTPRDKKPITYDGLYTPDNDGSVILNLGLYHDNVGWVAIKTDKVLDLSKRDHRPDDFWEELEYLGKNMWLFRDRFYILATHEGIRIPPYLAAEIAPMDEMSLEARAHYAGFFDPCWGWGKTGEGLGDIGTLEIRPFENIMVRHKQPICKFKFGRTFEIPDTGYGTISGSNYTGQSGPRLSKHFMAA